MAFGTFTGNMTSHKGGRRHGELAALAVISSTLLAVRLGAATRVGFGDSEALYASYAIHPQPAYLDHPGLIGVVARVIGGGDVPGPIRAHFATSLAATAVPWLMVLACRACGTSWRRAFAGGLFTALVPEMAIGLFGLTPDLPLALAWLGAIGLAALALRQSPSAGLATVFFGASGVLAGVAAASKVSGVLLIVALAAAYAMPPARGHARTIAPWAGLAAAFLAVAPVAWFEARLGFPMLRHRVVETQSAAGWSLRNLGALLGGQFLYLSPGGVVLAAAAMRSVWRGRHDAVGALLFCAWIVPASALAPLCLWSRVAEPHWLAPALLALVPAQARASTGPSSRSVRASMCVAGVMVLVVHAWVLVPAAVRLAPASYDARLDIANELYGWPDVVTTVKDELTSVGYSMDHPQEDVAVVAPHWVLCGQLEVRLHDLVHVGCNTPIPDDFDVWWPRPRWHGADVIIWVSDERFGPPPQLPQHVVVRSRTVRIVRAGRLVRQFTVTTLDRRALARAS